MAPRRSSRLQSRSAAPYVLPVRGRGRHVTPGKPSAVPLDDVLEVLLLALGDSTLALQVAVMVCQASRANRATVTDWRQTISRFHLDFGSRELKRCTGGGRAVSTARQSFVLRQMWKCWAPHATAIILAPRFRPVDKHPLAAQLSGLLQLKLSQDGASVRSVNDPAMVASSGCSVIGPLMTTDSGTYTVRLRFDGLPYNPSGYVSLGMVAATSKLVMGPGHAPDQVAWIFRFGASSVVACFEERLVHSLVIRGEQIRPPVIEVADELSLSYDTARRTCASMATHSRLALAACKLGSCATSGRAWRLWAAHQHAQRERSGQWAPDHCLGCSREPPQRSPIPPRLAIQAHVSQPDTWRRGSGHPAQGHSQRDAALLRARRHQRPRRHTARARGPPASGQLRAYVPAHASGRLAAHVY